MAHTELYLLDPVLLDAESVHTGIFTNRLMSKCLYMIECTYLELGISDDQIEVQFRLDIGEADLVSRTSEPFSRVRITSCAKGQAGTAVEIVFFARALYSDELALWLLERAAALAVKAHVALVEHWPPRSASGQEIMDGLAELAAARGRGQGLVDLIHQGRHYGLDAAPSPAGLYFIDP